MSGRWTAFSPGRRRLLGFVAALALAAILAIGLSQAGGGPSLKRVAVPRTVAARLLSGSPPPLAAIHGQANHLLPGGPRAFQARLQALRGFPIVVNKWASWCGPCRAEFPLFQRLSVADGRRIAFLGVDSNDNHGDAAQFLRELPVTYPSYEDPDLKIAQVINAVAAFPTTVFYDAGGRLTYRHQGAYPSLELLRRDIARYARPRS